MGCMDFQPEVRAKGGGEVAFFFFWLRVNKIKKVCLTNPWYIKIYTNLLPVDLPKTKIRYSGDD